MAKGNLNVMKILYWNPSENLKMYISCFLNLLNFYSMANNPGNSANHIENFINQSAPFLIPSTNTNPKIKISKNRNTNSLTKILRSHNN
jgi:hypothetical protein